MIAVENIGTSSEVKEEYEKLKICWEEVSFISSKGKIKAMPNEKDEKRNRKENSRRRKGV